MSRLIYICSIITMYSVTSCKTYKYESVNIDGDSYINVKSIGVIGDGKTNDVLAIQDAFNKYKNVFFPKGKYLISSASSGTHNPQSILIDDKSKVRNIYFEDRAKWVVSKNFNSPTIKNTILKIFADKGSIDKISIKGFNLFCEKSDNGIGHLGIFAIEHNGHYIKNLEIENANLINCSDIGILTFALSTKLKNIFTENTANHGIAAINRFNHGVEHEFYLDGYKSVNDLGFSIDFSGTDSPTNRVDADPSDVWKGEVKNVISINSKRGIKTAGYWNLKMENVQIINPEFTGLWLSKDTPGKTVECKNMTVINAGYTGMSITGDCNFIGDSLTFIGCKEGVQLHEGTVNINKLTIDGKNKSVMGLRFLTSGSIENFSIKGNKDDYIIWLNGEKSVLKNGSIFNNDCKYGIIVHENPKLTIIENVQFYDERLEPKQLNDIVIIQKTGLVKIARDTLSTRNKSQQDLRIDNRSGVRVSYLNE